MMGFQKKSASIHCREKHELWVCSYKKQVIPPSAWRILYGKQLTQLYSYLSSSQHDVILQDSEMPLIGPPDSVTHKCFSSTAYRLCLQDPQTCPSYAHRLLLLELWKWGKHSCKIRVRDRKSTGPADLAHILSWFVSPAIHRHKMQKPIWLPVLGWPPPLPPASP